MNESKYGSLLTSDAKILRNYFNVGILFFSGLSMPKLKTAWQSKYNVDFKEVENDILQV